MEPVIFWDVDTQVDFIKPDGKLAVLGAESIVSNLEKLTRLARERHIPLVMSMDSHDEHDPEISRNPDFQNTFPPHCLMGTEGWKKIPESAPLRPLYVGKEAMPDLRERLARHPGEVVILKSRFDVCSNPNTSAILEFYNPRLIVVYGVTTEVCVRYAVEGFLRRRRHSVILVEDAVKPIQPGGEKELLESWAQQGVRLVGTTELPALLQPAHLT